MSSLVTLTTDYGTESPYVAALKGVLLGINPEATLLDLTHQIPPQNIAHVSFFLQGCLPCFPAGSLHVVVVDPGVGTQRALLHISAGGQQLLAPDNGCWTAAVSLLGPPVVRRLTEPRFWRKHVAHTFHGRDILAPVAGYLTLGIAPDSLGPLVDQWQTFTAPRACLEGQRLTGEIVFIDTFGNLVTNIPGEAFQALTAPRFHVGGPVQPRIVRTYGDAAPGTLVALVTSQNRLEIAVAQGSAARQLGCGIGTPVVIEGGAGDATGA